MKFWVKAITDDNVQEQLLVNATNSAELVAELSALLHTHVARTSITDFHTQVEEKLRGGADIITVKVVTQETSTAATAASTGTAMATASSFSFAAYGADADAAALQSRRGSSLAAHDSLHVPSRGGGDDDDDDARRTSLRSRSFTDTAMPITPPARSLFEKPKVDRICLSRDDVEMLLHPAHGGAYHSVVCGSFVRIRENNEYVLYQILRPVGSVELVLDMIHYEATRRTEVVSNAAPAAQEVQAWSRKMVAASRDFLTDGFIEAKASDIDFARSAAEASAESLISARVTPCAQALNGSGRPLTPPSSAESKRQQHQQWRHRRVGSAAPLVPSTLQQSAVSVASNSCWGNSLCAGAMRVSLKTNDVLQHTQVVVVEEPESGECDLALFASRRANGGKKKPRLSDFAGCIIKISKNHGIISDRDVTEKGYDMFSSPQRWDCHYVVLGQIRPSVGDRPYKDSKQSYVQEFTVLSGRFLTGLFNPPTVTTLPIPKWAQLEGMSSQIIRPQLIVHNEKIHVFYLIQLSPSQDQEQQQQQQQTQAQAQARAQQQIPSQSRRSSLDCGDRSGEGLGMRENIVTGGGELSISTNSFETSFPNSMNVDLPVEPLLATNFDQTASDDCQYGLAHAVAADVKLHTWREMTTREPLRLSARAVPIFTVASVAAPAAHDADGGSMPRALQFLWYEEERPVSGGAPRPAPFHRRISSACPSPSQTTLRRAALPFERWISAHPDGAPGHWARRPLFPAGRVDVDALKPGLASLSLYEHESVLCVAAVQVDAHQRLTVTTIPLAMEP